MSQLASIPEVPAEHCNLCHDMSTWSFLGEFYNRVDNAHQHSASLEYDLSQAAQSLQQCNIALIQYKESLSISYAKLDEERLEHGATQKALDLEVQSHRETEKLFDLTYQAVVESGDLVDGLRAQVVELQGGGSPLRTCPTTADLLLELQLSRDQLRRLETSISSSQSHQIADA